MIMMARGRRNPNDSRNAIGDEPFLLRMVQLKVLGSYPTVPQISVKGRSMTPCEKIQTKETIVQVLFLEKSPILVGNQTRTTRLMAIMAMLRAETPMLAKKKKEKMGQDTSRSNIQLLVMNLLTTNKY